MCVCVVWDKLSITFVPDSYGHLSSHSGSSGTLLFNAGLIYLTPRASPLFLFPFALSSPSFSLSLSDTHPSTHLLLKGHRERKREMAPVIFPSFKWDSAALSVTEPLRGGHPAKEEPFTLYCILLQRAHISFHTLSICLSTSFFFFTLLSYPLNSSFRPPLLPPLHLFLVLYFMKFEGLTVPFEHASLSKTQLGQREERDSAEQQRGDGRLSETRAGVCQITQMFEELRWNLHLDRERNKSHM